MFIRLNFLYNYQNEHLFYKKGMYKPMNKRKQDLINRIEKLTDKQFELLINLFSQQEQEFVQVVQFEHPSFSQSSE